MRLFLPVLALLLFTACKDKKYCDCCENEGLSARFPLNINPDHPDSLFTEALLYVPNIMVYEGDGINNFFLVFSNAGVVEIISLEVEDKKGNRLFSRYNVMPADIGAAWTGVTSGGTRFEGSFNYTLVVRLYDGQVKTLEGSACAFPCGEEGFPTNQLDNCRFTTQNNGNGEYDPTQPGALPGCFE